MLGKQNVTQITPKTYLNILCRASDVYKMWQQLGKARDPEAWEMYPSMVNAYFNPPANEVGSLYYSVRPILLLMCAL